MVATQIRPCESSNAESPTVEGRPFETSFPLHSVWVRSVRRKLWNTPVLEAAQIDIRQLHLDKTVVDLRVVLRDCVRAMGEDSSLGSRLVFEAASRRVPVRADPDRLCTMVVNLVENAFRHSPEGGDIRCSVSTSGRRARVAVSDQGPAIPPQELPRLFTRFGASSFAGGLVASSGLGLYLVRELARLHGGDVEVHTMAGGGSTFTVVLPLAESRWTRLRRGSGASEAAEPAKPAMPPRSPP